MTALVPSFLDESHTFCINIYGKIHQYIKEEISI